ncbi:MAG TPA: ABC transporter permease [Acidimicrobiales bacterium]|nr:ABC transporter permease [Acidimicrobiales bacterium]
MSGVVERTTVAPRPGPEGGGGTAPAAQPAAVAVTAPAVRPWARAALCITARYALTVAAIVVIVFALPRFMPGDPLAVYDSVETPLSPEARAALEEFYGLDRPLPQQFGAFVAHLARGDFGHSIASGMPVSELVRDRLPWTMLLAGTALLAASAVSFAAGLAAAWRRGERQDRALVTGMVAINSIPEYAIASVFMLTFAFVVPVFPTTGAQSPFPDYDTPFHAVGDVAVHLALPAAALTLSLLGTKFLLVRNTVLSALGQEYMLFARAKGLTERRMKYHHAGRNAVVPFLTVLGMQAGFAVGGSLFVETVFAYPGMATLIRSAIDNRDFPVLDASFLVLAVVVLVANFLVELVAARLDPNLRGPA